MFSFDPTFNIGTMIEIVTIVAGGVYFIQSMNHKISTLIEERQREQNNNIIKFDNIDEQLKQLTEALVKLARQDERINALNQRFQTLLEKIEIRPKIEKIEVKPKSKTKSRRQHVCD